MPTFGNINSENSEKSYLFTYKLSFTLFSISYLSIFCNNTDNSSDVNNMGNMLYSLNKIDNSIWVIYDKSLNFLSF